jgi:hypothetical protein
MAELRNVFTGGLNLDDSYYTMPKQCYVDALNITRDAISANHDRIISNLVGNRNILYTFPAGTNTTIGAIGNQIRNTAIAFVWNSNGNHSIVEYNLTTRLGVKIFENLTDSDDVDILGFTQNGKITGINIFNRDEGDLLFFLDSLGRPTFMNITLFKAGAYTPVTRQIIDVCKVVPASPPSAVYGNDATRTSNYLQKKLFRFKQRYVYDDNLKSTYSPISAVPLPVDILDPDYTNVLTNNNRITVSLTSGAKNVKAVEIAVSIANSSNIFGRFQTVASINKETESIDDDTTFSYEFYNDSVYPYISDEASLPLFDYVPLYAKAQEMPNGRLCYGAITEGYDRTLDPNVTLTVNTVAAGDGSVVGSLSVVHTAITPVVLWTDRLEFSGIPAVGTVVNVYYVQAPDPPALAGTYTTIAGDTAADVVNGLGASMDVINVFQNVTEIGNRLFFDAPGSINFSSVEIVSPSTSATANSIMTWLFWGQRRMGIAYYDEQGRTNGVLYDASFTLPGYAENGSQQVLLPYLNIKIYHRPPDWAYSYQIVFTKDNTQILYIETVDVQFDSDYTYLDITNLGINQQKNPTTSTVVSWTFQEGDRVRLIKRIQDTVTYGNDYQTEIVGIVTDPVINGTTNTGKTFVKVEKSINFTLGGSYDNYVIKLYRPSLQEPNDENATFFECGVQYPILNPTESTRVHAGQITDQSTDLVTPAEIDIYEGDVYFRLRNEFASSNPADTGYLQFYVQDRNFVDFYISAVNNIDGRPSAIDLDAAQTYFPSVIRFGQPYEINTNINGLNKFLAENLEEVEYSYGDIMRLKVRARFMRVYQKLRVGVIYLFSKLAKAPQGDDVMVNTDNLLNPVQYYTFDAGIGEQAESLASFNDADYFTSNITGGIYRVSQDGITPLHILYKMNSWATSNLPSRNGSYKVYGAFDQKLNNYIIALEATETEEAVTLSFSEEDNSFESFLSFKPEMMVTVGTTLISFYQGQMYTHDSDSYNTFYGTSYESNIKLVFNDAPQARKQPMSLTVNSNSKWDCPEIITSVKSYGSTPQTSTLVEPEIMLQEGAFSAAFRRDSNSRGGKISGSFLKGQWVSVKFRKQSATSLSTIELVSLKWLNSPLNM